jgi:hypothetical protein
MQINFILASDWPQQSNLGLFSWRYAYNYDPEKDCYYHGRTFAIGLIFFHFGISFSKKNKEDK